MKINRAQLHAMNPYKKNDVKLKQSQQSVSYQRDKLEISSEAKELSEITTHSAERTDHVEQIKQQVQSGNYKVNYEKLAKSLINYFQ